MILKSYSELKKIVLGETTETLLVRPCTGSDLTEALLEIESWQLNSGLNFYKSARILIMIDAIGDQDIDCLDELFPEYIFLRKCDIIAGSGGILSEGFCGMANLSIETVALLVTWHLLSFIRKLILVRNCYCLKNICIDSSEGDIVWCNHSLVSIKRDGLDIPMPMVDKQSLKEGCVIIRDECRKKASSDEGKCIESLFDKELLNKRQSAFSSLLAGVVTKGGIIVKEFDGNTSFSDHDLSVYSGITIDRIKQCKLFFCQNARNLINRRGFFEELRIPVENLCRKLSSAKKISGLKTLRTTYRYGMTLEQSPLLFNIRHCGLLNLYKTVVPALIEFLPYSKIFYIDNLESDDRIILWVKNIPPRLRIDLSLLEPLDRSSGVELILKYTNPRRPDDCDGVSYEQRDIYKFIKGLELLCSGARYGKNGNTITLHLCCSSEGIGEFLNFLENYFISNFYLMRDL